MQNGEDLEKKIFEDAENEEEKNEQRKFFLNSN